MKTASVWGFALGLMLTVHGITAVQADCQGGRVVEIVFSFDTTGSMSSVIALVRRQVADLIDRLLSDIPEARISVCAHGDYSDSYVVKCMDFSSDSPELQYFVLNIGNTGGGDAPEAYEQVLYEMNNKNISWSDCSTKSLVMIGDEEPHPANYKLNKNRVDWLTEVNKLAQKNVKIYAVRALNAKHAEYFYKRMAEVTGGYYLRFLTFDYIFDFMMAITYREYGLPLLLAYIEEVHSKYSAQDKQTPKELSDLFATLKSKDGSTTVPITDPYLNVAKYLPPLKPYVPPPKSSDMDIYYLHAKTDIDNRFASTQVTSKLANKLSKATEAVFHMDLPEAAFIMNFTIERNGEIFVAEVKEKKEAKKIYDKAKEQGKSAGHVSTQPKSTNSFKIAVNVAAESKVIFNLKYQELLERRRGLYEHRFQINPGQIVADFKIDTNIRDSREISKLVVPPLSLGNAIAENPGTNTFAVITRPTPTSATVSFSPSVEQQKQMSQSDSGAYGALSVFYDLKRTGTYGSKFEVDQQGYFKHSLAPNFPAMNRKIMFVLDTSGSMSFRKMVQLKEAMLAILDQLIEGDYFNIMTFSSFFRKWKESMLPVNSENINSGKEFVRKMFAAGGTNIYKALQMGIESLNKATDTNPAILVFLTDGRPTDGERNTTKIRLDVRQQTEEHRISLYCLAFGSQANRDFLTKLAGEGGFARRIYDAFDAALQLKNFYSEISELQLVDVEIKYPANVIIIDSITQHKFKRYFEGSEIVIAGRLSDFENTNELTCEVIGTAKTGNVKYETKINVQNGSTVATSSKEDAFMERMWAYLTIKQLVRGALIAQDDAEKERLNNRSLELSLQYNFVTPVTSMVVVLPEDKPNDKDKTLNSAEETDDEEDFLTDDGELFRSGSRPESGMMPVDEMETHYDSGDILHKGPPRKGIDVKSARSSSTDFRVGVLELSFIIAVAFMKMFQVA